MSDDIKALTDERKKTHGSFSDHARVTQHLKDIMKEEELFRAQRGQPPLLLTQRESLEMIFHKVGRILAGESSFQDHWDDIAGYAKIANGQD